MPHPCGVGVDISKATLDVAASTAPGQPWQTTNDEAGWAALVAHVLPLQPRVIVLEATGGYEIGVATALTAAGLPVAIVNPRQVRDFARALGALEKTDRRDAAVLAAFAARMQPTPRPLPMISRPTSMRWSPDAGNWSRCAPLSAIGSRWPAVPSARICSPTSPGSKSRSATLTAISTAGLRPVRSGASAITGSNPSPASARPPRPVCWLTCPSSARSPPPDQQTRRRRAPSRRQRDAPRLSARPRRARRGPLRVIHGHRHGHHTQSHHPRRLPAMARGRQTPQGRPRRRHAQTPHSSQCHAQTPLDLAGPGGQHRLTSDTVATRSLARRFAGALRSRGSLAALARS